MPLKAANYLRDLGPMPAGLPLLIDRPHEGNETRQLVLELGMVPIVPPKSNRVDPWRYDFKGALTQTERDRTPLQKAQRSRPSSPASRNWTASSLPSLLRPHRRSSQILLTRSRFLHRILHLPAVDPTAGCRSSTAFALSRWHSYTSIRREAASPYLRNFCRAGPGLASLSQRKYQATVDSDSTRNSL